MFRLVWKTQQLRGLLHIVCIWADYRVKNEYIISKTCIRVSLISDVMFLWALSEIPPLFPLELASFSCRIHHARLFFIFLSAYEHLELKGWLGKHFYQRSMKSKPPCPLWSSAIRCQRSKITWHRFHRIADCRLSLAFEHTESKIFSWVLKLLNLKLHDHLQQVWSQHLESIHSHSNLAALLARLQIKSWRQPLEHQERYNSHSRSWALQNEVQHRVCPDLSLGKMRLREDIGLIIVIVISRCCSHILGYIQVSLMPPWYWDDLVPNLTTEQYAYATQFLAVRSLLMMMGLIKIYVRSEKWDSVPNGHEMRRWLMMWQRRLMQEATVYWKCLQGRGRLCLSCPWS